MSTPVKTLPQNSGSVFLDISAGRKTANNAATIIVWATMILAMIPLVWVLWELFSAVLVPSSPPSGGPFPSAESSTPKLVVVHYTPLSVLSCRRFSRRLSPCQSESSPLSIWWSTPAVACLAA